MPGPRNPDDDIEPMLVEHERRFPTDAQYQRAVNEGMFLSDREAGIVDEEDESLGDAYDDHLRARGF